MLSMIKPIDYNFVGDVLDKEVKQQGYGSKSYDWKIVGQIRGYIFTFTGSERNVSGKVSTESTHQIISPTNKEIKTHQRIKVADRVYEVLFINEVTPKQMEIEVRVIV